MPKLYISNYHYVVRWYDIIVDLIHTYLGEGDTFAPQAIFVFENSEAPETTGMLPKSVYSFCNHIAW